MQSNELATTANNEIAAPAPTWTPEQVDLIKRTVCRGASDDELKLFLHVCQRTQLDPFARQIHALKIWNSKENREVMQIHVSIDGHRLIAERSGQYAGQSEPEFCAADGKWTTAWLSDEPPVAARVGVYRKDFRDPVYGLARYKSFVQIDSKGKPVPVWQRMPEHMLAKVAESLAFRRAFPFELGGLHAGFEIAGYSVDGAAQQPKEINFKKHLGERLLSFCNGVQAGAEQILDDLCGKRSLTEVSQDEAKRAIEEFESRYLGAEPRID